MLGLGVEYLEHALHGAKRLANLAVERRELAQTDRDGDRIDQEAADGRELQPAGQHLAPAEPEDRGDRAKAQEGHQRREARPKQRQPQGRA